MVKSIDELIRDINNKKEKAIESGIIKRDKPQNTIEEKDMAYKLPDNWKWIRLGDYCMKVTDYVASGSFASLKQNVTYYDTENYALMVKTADFSNNFTKNLTYTDEKSYKFLSNSNLFGGELILSNIGSIGKVFKVPYLNRPMTLASNTIMIKFTDDELVDYIYYYFKSQYGQNALNSISSGTSMLKFNKTQLKTLPLPIPNIYIQKKIINCLNKSQQLIDKRKEQIEALDELVKSQFIEMFGDPINNKNNFDITCIDEITDLVTYGLTVRPAYVEDGVRVISAAEIRTGIVNYDVAKQIATEDYEKLTEKSKPQKNELLLGKAGASIGYCAIIDKDIPFAITQNIARIKIRENIVNPYWLMYYLKSDFIQQLCQREAKGNAIKDLQIQSIKAIPVLACPLEVQNKFVDFIKQTDKLKFEMEKSLKELEDNFNSLMQKAFKGELFN